MTELLAMASAISFGFSDFIGGAATKEAAGTRVALRGAFAAIIFGLAAWALLGGEITLRDSILGAASGVAGITGIVFLFKALAAGPMAAVSPITALISAVIPFTIGLLAGDRPSTLALVGASFGLVAVVMVSGVDRPAAHRAARSTIVMSIIAGLGFGGFFAIVAQIESVSGTWPLIPAKVTAFALLLIVSRRAGGGPLGRRIVALAYAAGAIDMLANVFFVLATRTGALPIVAVITSFYPAVTVALGRFVFGEHLSRVQLSGLGLTVVSLALMSS